jgi:hypothetical protein
MPPVLIVSGSLSQIRDKLMRIKATLKAREATGYSVYAHSFVYRYTPAGEDACPKCLPMQGELYNGEYVQEDFPHNEPVRAGLIYAHQGTAYHEAHRCRCTFVLTNMGQAIITMLLGEMETA